jgi:phage tail-like protein
VASVYRFDSGIKPADRHPSSTISPDPLTQLRWAVTIDQVEVGHFQECSGLQIEYEVLEWPEGGQNRFVHKLRGRAKQPNLVLKRGVTNQDGLIKWFHNCINKAERRHVLIELKAGDGKTIRTWGLEEAFPVKWTGPTFNASQANVAMETLELAHKGFSESDKGLKKGG